MKQRARKFVGIWIILFLLIAYPLGIAVVYSEYLTQLPIWGTLGFFVITGIFWAFPAGIVIKWMARPDDAV
ncbi:MAG: DUF2842 domain-containing protein [Devosiaceae bacterium]|nr:DUF2842 domain-containing protein [Devosiaceae bacterium]